MTSLSFSRFHYEFIIYFRNSLRIRYLFREFFMNSQSTSRFYYKFTICFMNSRWINLFMNSLSYSRIHWRCIIILANSLWFHHLFCELYFESIYLFREFTIHSLFSAQMIRHSSSFSRINYVFLIFFVKALEYPWILYLSLELTMFSLFLFLRH